MLFHPCSTHQPTKPYPAITAASQPKWLWLQHTCCCAHPWGALLAVLPAPLWAMVSQTSACGACGRQQRHQVLQASPPPACCRDSSRQPARPCVQVCKVYVAGDGWGSWMHECICTHSREGQGLQHRLLPTCWPAACLCPCSPMHGPTNTRIRHPHTCLPLVTLTWGQHQRQTSPYQG